MDAKAQKRLKKAGGQALANAADVARQAQILIVSLSTSKALSLVTQAIASVPNSARPSQQIVIETSTLPMANKDACAQQLRKAGVATLDAPISGTKMKFAANHLVAIYNAAYAESATLARKMGLDPREVLKLFGHEGGGVAKRHGSNRGHG